MAEELTYESRSPNGTPTANRVCPKCNASMRAGYLLDRTYGALTQCAWVEGLPKKGIFGSLKVSRRQAMPVTTYRCGNCGFLESFAMTV